MAGFVIWQQYTACVSHASLRVVSVSITLDVVFMNAFTVLLCVCSR